MRQPREKPAKTRYYSHEESKERHEAPQIDATRASSRFWAAISPKESPASSARHASFREIYPSFPASDAAAKAF
jgi:hypothetical protein